MITKFYVDTSVFGGYFDPEFEEATRNFFEELRYKGKYILYSELTRNELVNAPERVKEFVNSLPEEMFDYIEITDEALQLSDKYIKENVVGKASREDCLHIALATVNRADVLVSWNFKHIVNLRKIRGYNSVNLKAGYPFIEIRSPLELIDYENEK